jgi:ATP-binding cassette subfamily B protein
LGSIVFDKVLYGNKSRPYLKNISFTIEPKTITVITGKNGSDKNGIFDLLLRLNSQHSGLITIDDIDIQNYDEDVYYNLISSVREQPTFFSISIKENLEIIEPDFVKIVEVCKKLKIHDDIMNLSDGYATILTTSGDNLNPSTRNLLSIARVLLKDPKIILFYDNFSTFDREILENILEIIKEKKSNHTIVIIGRNEQVLKIADKIIVVENGKLKSEKTVKSKIQEESSVE